MTKYTVSWFRKVYTRDKTDPNVNAGHCNKHCQPFFSSKTLKLNCLDLKNFYLY